MKTKELNTNIEVYNYLNITNRRLGKLYKYSGYNPLPENFDVNETTIKERLTLNEMQNSDIFPPFILEEKKYIKKYLKNSVKNIQKIKKLAKNAEFLQKFSSEFLEKFGLYLDMRTELSNILLQDFKNQDCDEVEIYREIFNLDSVFGELLEEFYQPKICILRILDGLEEKYELSYSEKLKALEKKDKKRKQKAKNQIEQMAKICNKKSSQNQKKKAAALEKTAKNKQKSENLKEIQTFKAQVKSTKTDKKQNNKGKEKE